MSADTSASVRPTSGISPRLELGRHPVGGVGDAARRAAISAASLTARMRPGDVAGLAPRRRGQLRPAGRRGSGPRSGRRWPAVPAGPTRPPTTRDRVVGLVPRVDGEHVGPLDHPGRLQPGHHQRGVAVDRAAPAWSAARAAWPRSPSATGRSGPTDSSRTSMPAARHGGTDPVEALGMHGPGYGGRCGDRSTGDRRGARRPWW